MDYIRTKSVYCISYITLKTGIMGTVEEDSVIQGDNIFVIENNNDIWRAYKEYKAVVKDSSLELWVDLNKLNRIIKDYKNMTKELRMDKAIEDGKKELEIQKDLCRKLEDINKKLEERLEK